MLPVQMKWMIIAQSARGTVSVAVGPAFRSMTILAWQAQLNAAGDLDKHEAQVVVAEDFEPEEKSVPRRLSAIRGNARKPLRRVANFPFLFP